MGTAQDQIGIPQQRKCSACGHTCSTMEVQCRTELVIIKHKDIKSYQIEQSSGRKIEVIVQNIMGNIQEHYSKTIASKEIGGRSWRSQSESSPLLIYVLQVFIEIENTRTKRQFDVGCTN
jgi:transcriptional regulator NrdR family protein